MSAKMSRFKILYGCDPPHLIRIGHGQTQVNSLDELLQEREAILDDLQYHLITSQHKMKRAADEKRRDESFQLGDQVYLNNEKKKGQGLGRKVNQVLNFMWLKFFLIWRCFRFWTLVSGIETPENMPKCINNCYNLESFWKNWHASFNKWLVRYMYIPLGGSQRKLVNVWVIFTFVAIWHDLEWKLLSWAWLTCIFFIPEMIVKSAANTLKVESMFGVVIWHELQAVFGAITITFLMDYLVLGGLFLTFYVGTKLMIHISDAKQRRF